MLGAGRRDTRVQFQAKAPADKDPATGQRQDGGWATYASRWALVEALSGRELEFARQVIATATHRVTVPAAGLLGVVKPSHRLLVGPALTPMEIGSALPKGGLKEELVVTATQRAD